MTKVQNSNQSADSISAGTKEKKLKKPVTPRILFMSGEELYDFFNTNKVKVREYMINAIKYGAKNKLPDMNFFELQYAVDNVNIIALNFDKSEWKVYLTELIEDLAKEDNFEQCDVIKKLNDSL